MDKEQYFEALRENVFPDDLEFVRSLPERVRKLEPFRIDESGPDVFAFADVVGERVEVWVEESEEYICCEFFAVTTEGDVDNLLDESAPDAEPFAEFFEKSFGRRSGVTVADLRGNWEAFGKELKEQVELFVETLEKEKQ
jgi:hypothetical protein